MDENIEQRIENVEDAPNDGDFSIRAMDVFTPDDERKENEKKHIHWLTIMLLYGLVVFAVIIAVVVLWHLVVPEYLRWLKPNEIISLKSIFVSGVGGAILAKFGNKLVEDK